MNAPAAIVVLTKGGRVLAERLRAALPHAQVHGLSHRVPDADVTFTDATAQVAALFATGRPIIGICAAGILIRAVAAQLTDKHAEPPLLAVAEDGSAVVPLLGGHRGGNALARRIADALDVAPALTTAGDAVFGVSLDDPPAGWTVANPQVAKVVMAAQLAGEPVRLVVDAGDAGWLSVGDANWAGDGALAVRVTDRAVDTDRATATLLLHPPTLALGLGCERGAEPAEAIALAESALADAGLAAASVAVVVSLDVKMDEPAVHAVADRFGVPARFFDAATLDIETPRLANPSDYVFRTVGCHGVAEGAAMAAAGAAGALIVPKTRGVRTTCAIARAPAGDLTQVGRPQGRLTILGTGPGDVTYRLPAADRALATATDIVGYGLYTDLLGNAASHLTRHDFDLGEETARCRHALDLAAAGQYTVLVSSGDPGIYAMAALVFELLDRAANPAWARIAVDVVPGVSAMQLAAARAGAPLGHDFCAISLSDLLTPWQVIETRIRAAAAADFVVAFYNPVSRRRQSQLAVARDILLACRSPNTPVVVARNLARPGETVIPTTLAALDPAALDMLSVVIVGSSASRALSHAGRTRIYTPRGYAAAASARSPGMP